MGKRQSPETEVRRSVGHAVEAEFYTSQVSKVVSKPPVSHKHQLTNGVNNLVNNYFTQLKLLMLLVINIFRDHMNASIKAIATVAINGPIAIFVITISGNNMRRLANSTITLGSRLLMLLPEHVGLETQHDGDLNHSDEEQDVLNERLAGIQLDVDRAGLQEHVNQHVQQAGGLPTDAEPVDRPLVDDADD